MSEKTPSNVPAAADNREAGMGPGATASRTVLDVVLHQWPSSIFLPSVLVLVGVLVAVTRWQDGRDRARRDAVAARPAGLRSAPRLPIGGRRPWWRRTRCTCSWHTAAQAGALVPVPPGSPDG